VDGYGKDLTDAEIVVLQSAAHGLSVAKTATFVGFSESHVKTLRARVCEKLKATNTANAVFLACRHRVIDIDCDAALLEVAD